MTEAFWVTSAIVVLLLVAWLWHPQARVERGAQVLGIAYTAMGAWALWFAFYAAPGQEPAGFAFWKPTVLLWSLAIIQLVAPLLRWGYPFKAIFGNFLVFSTRQWRTMNLASAVLFAVLGGANLLSAFNLSEGDWEGFKYSCKVLLMFVILLRLNFVWLELATRIAIHLYRRAKGTPP